MLTAKMCLYKATEEPVEQWTWFLRLDDDGLIVHPDKLYAKTKTESPRRNAERSMNRAARKHDLAIVGIIEDLR